jgi:ATP-dependent exoDNAse (exonuclease V) alpha subunit
MHPDGKTAELNRNINGVETALTHYAMLQRNLIYTGLTRGKKLVVLVGQKKALAIAVKNISGRRRWSKLDEWLGAT